MNKHLSSFFFRGGKNLGNKTFLSDNDTDEVSVVMTQFLIFFYKNNTPPKGDSYKFDLNELKIVTSIISKKVKI